MKIDVVITFLAFVITGVLGVVLMLCSAIPFLVRAILATLCFIVAAMSWGVMLFCLTEE